MPKDYYFTVNFKLKDGEKIECDYEKEEFLELRNFLISPLETNSEFIDLLQMPQGDKWTHLVHRSEILQVKTHVKYFDEGENEE